MLPLLQPHLSLTNYHQASRTFAKSCPSYQDNQLPSYKKFQKATTHLHNSFCPKKNIKKQPEPCKHSIRQILTSILLTNLQAHLTSPSNSHTSNHTQWWEKENPHKGFHPLLQPYPFPLSSLFPNLFSS